MRTVVLIPGDGIGPEVAAAARTIVDASGAKIDWAIEEAGAHMLAKAGALVPDSVFAAIEKHRVALKGPITTPIGSGFRSINVSLRQKYDLYANVRPVKSLLRGGRTAGGPIDGPTVVPTSRPVDLVIFRENTEDLYAGRETKISDDEVHAIKVITRAASERICVAAFEYAKARGRKSVTAVHKANIMKLADGLFLDAFRKVAAGYPGIATGEVIVDNMCMQLVQKPDAYDVIVTENLYGDILSDLAAGLVGGLGLVPGANVGKDCAIFEAVHGSAPDIAGKGLANPVAITLSAAMMLDHVGEADAAGRIRRAVSKAVNDAVSATPDLGGEGTTETMTSAIVAAMG